MAADRNSAERWGADFIVSDAVSKQRVKRRFLDEQLRRLLVYGVSWPSKWIVEANPLETNQVTPATLTRIGLAAFGKSYQKQLADYLHVDDRTIRHWRDGTLPIPEGVRDDLRRLVKDRRRLLLEALEELE